MSLLWHCCGWAMHVPPYPARSNGEGDVGEREAGSGKGRHLKSDIGRHPYSEAFWFARTRTTFSILFWFNTPNRFNHHQCHQQVFCFLAVSIKCPWKQARVFPNFISGFLSAVDCDWNKRKSRSTYSYGSLPQQQQEASPASQNEAALAKQRTRYGVCVVEQRTARTTH